MELKNTVYDVLETGERHPRLARIVGWTITGLVVANVAAAIVETMPAAAHFKPAFLLFEKISVVLFLVEYVARVWSATVSPNYAGAVLGRIRFALTPLAVIDLLAILPSLLGLGGVTDLRSLRLLRLMRILRLLKLGRYSQSLRLLGHVLRKTKGELAICVFIATLLMIIAASAMFRLEHSAQPEAFSSIPATMWWAVATLTTVGYGDMYPVTDGGRLVGAFVALLGIGLFALPAGILGGAFVEELRSTRGNATASESVCPHCGRTASE